jgi:signal transduction histidine kinase
MASVSSALHGMMMLITPHHYYVEGFKLVHSSLPVIGYLFLGLGCFLLFTISINPIRWRIALAHIGIAILFVFVAISFAIVGQWGSSSIFIVFALCVLGAGFISLKQLTLNKQQTVSIQGDLFVALLALLAACQGWFLIVSRLQIGSNLAVLYLLFGLLYIVGGSLLLWAQLSRRIQRRHFEIIHFSLCGLFMTYLCFSWLTTGINGFMVFQGASVLIMCLLTKIGPLVDKREPNSLRVRLGVILPSVAILPLTVVVGLLCDRMELLALEEAKLAQRMQSTQYAQQIEKNTHKRFDRFMYMAQQISHGRDNPRLQQQILLNFGNDEPYLLECALYDEQGQERLSLTFQQGPAPYHQSMFDQLRSLYDAEQVKFRFIPQSDGSKGHVVLAAAIEEALTFSGMVACSFDQLFLETMVKQITPEASQRVAILNEEGQELIGYRGERFIFYPESLASDRSFRFVLQVDGLVQLESIGEQELITVYKHMPMFQWQMVTQYPVDETLQPIRHLRQTMLWLLLLLALIAMIGGMVLAAYLTKPLHMLMYAVDEFGHGRKDAPLPKGNVAEIAHLSEIFASMRAQLIKAAEEREQAIQMRDLFFSVAAHELKTPLTSLIGQAELLQRRARRDTGLLERYAQSINVIVAQAFRLNRMVTALLDISRLQHGRLVLDNELLDLQALIVQVLEEVRPTLSKHTIVSHSDTPEIMVYGDVLRLEQVIQNLINNAVKYSPNGGTIYVSLLRQGDNIEVQVRDEGIGIAAKDQPHLFERFFRAHTSQYSSIFGMGIGLYVVKEIVNLHQGTIEVESVEGQGSTFIVRLPLVKNIPVEKDQALTAT